MNVETLRATSPKNNKMLIIRDVARYVSTRKNINIKPNLQ